MHMRAYKAFDESGIEELGEVAKDQVSALIGEAEASQATDKQFGVGFYRSEKDFLEIRPVGKSEHMIWSDRITRSANTGLSSLFSKTKNKIDKVVIGQEKATEAVLYYMDYSREAFEQKYS
jgi:hypothetical protein